MHRRVRDTVVILEEGIRPLMHFPKCGVFDSWWDINRKHHAIAMCARGEERK